MTAVEPVVVPLPHGLSAIYVLRQPPPPPPPPPVLDDEPPWPLWPEPDVLALMTPQEIAALAATVTSPTDRRTT